MGKSEAWPTGKSRMAKPNRIALYVLGITRDFSTAVPQGVAPGRTDP